MKKLLIILISSFVLLLSACDPEVTNKETQSDKAKKAAESINFTSNAEINNIKKRLELTSDPEIIGYVLLLNEMGQPIMYTSVVGKITSGSKRLTPTSGCTRMLRSDSSISPYNCVSQDTVTLAPSDEGTWGSSAPYVYFWTAGGQYIQWNGKYLYSDKPFRTTIEPLIIKSE